MAYPTVAVTGDPVPPDWQVNITVEVLEPFTDHAPAKLWIKFTNEAPTKREYLFDSASPFDALVGRADDGKKVHALPDNDRPGANPYASMIPRSPVDGCWELAGSSSVAGFGRLRPVEPGETWSVTYVVLDDPDTADCLPPAQYQFAIEWGERYENDEESWHSWGFSIMLGE